MGLVEAAVAVGRLLVFAGLISAAIWDFSSRIIPNWLVLIVGAGGLMLRLATAERYGFWASVGTAAILFVVLRLLLVAGALAGGDVKLISVVALGQPAAAMLPILLGTGVAGGAIAVFYLIRDRTRRDDAPEAAKTSWRRLEMPYAPAILAGVVWHEFWTLAT